jgi:hypothetical protein
LDTKNDWKKILQHLLNNQNSPQKVTQVKIATKIHPEHLARHKERMEKEGLIKVEIRGWKEGMEKAGRAQFLSITEKGVMWYYNCLKSSLKKILEPLSQTLIGLTHETVVKDSFRKDLSAIAREDFDFSKNDVKNMFEPLVELFKNIMILQLWLQPNYHILAGVNPWMQLLQTKSPTPKLTLEDARRIVENNYFLFGPNMEGFVPVPSLPDDEKITMVYYQKTWKFVKQLSKHKGSPLPPQPLKSSPKNKDNNMM